MPIKYILDNRENRLRECFKSNKILFEEKQLDLGDIAILYSKSEINNSNISDNANRLLKRQNTKDEKIENNDPVYTILIERKSFTDLHSSISDGRYRDQKSRYIKLPKGSCYYILENNDPEFKTLDKKQYLGVYIHTILRDQIPVLITNGLIETFNFIIKMGETLEEFGFNGIDAQVLEQTQIKKKKAKGKEVYKQQICCIPGISSKKADLIVAQYPNIISLIDSIKNDKFKVKGIGKVLIQNIKDSLLLSDKF
jgi:ERCC4-type nuclease